VAQIFNRCLGDESALETGQFTVRTASGRPVLSCCMCGHIYELPKDCTIDQTGRVSHAVQCPAPMCGFWGYVILSDVWL
jgi:hypothetical protein